VGDHLGSLEQDCASAGQLYAAAMAHKQRHVEFFFELADLAAQGRLGDEKFACGAAEASRTGYAKEGTQFSDVDFLTSYNSFDAPLSKVCRKSIASHQLKVIVNQMSNSL
jgi:hypothetical protein